MSELWQLSATEAVRMLRRGEVSPLEMVDAAAARIEAVDHKVNALPIRFFDVARAEAETLRREGEAQPGWLAGLPMAVKDYNDVAGQLTTAGSPIFANHRAVRDDRTVATLRCNGAIPLAKSNVPEFAGSNPLVGRHAQSLGSGAHGRRLIGWRGCGACRPRGVARQRLVPRRLAAHSGKLLWDCRVAAEPRRRTAR